MNNLKENLLIVFVLFLALGLRIHYMTRSFFYDELYTVVHCIQVPTLLDAIYKNFSIANHLGYTAIAYPICHILGTKEWVLRLPALLFGLGGIYLFWYWTRKYFGKTTAMLGAFFLALAPAHIIWSASGRGYSACIFFSILSTALYFSLLEKPSLKTTLMLTLTNILASSFHLYFLCIFFAQLLHFLFISARSYTNHEPFIKKEGLFYILLSLGSTILCSIVIYCYALPTLASMGADHRAFVPDFPATLLNNLLSLPFWPLGLVCLTLMLIGFRHSTNKLPHWRLYVSVLFLMILPVWLAKPVYIYPRFFAYLLPFLFLLLASGMSSIIEKSYGRARPYIITACIGMLSIIIWSWVTKPSKIVEDFHYKFRESVEFAESVASDQTRFCAFGNEDGFFQFYSHRPVVTFKTFEDFKTFYKNEKEIICFSMIGLPMPDEHKKIALAVVTLLQPKEKNFDNIFVFDLKG